MILKFYAFSFFLIHLSVRIFIIFIFFKNLVIRGIGAFFGIGSKKFSIENIKIPAKAR